MPETKTGMIERLHCHLCGVRLSWQPSDCIYQSSTVASLTHFLQPLYESNENSAQQFVDVKGKNLKVYKVVYADDHIKSDDETDAIEIGGHGVSLFL